MKEVEERICIQADLEKTYQVAEDYPLFVSSFLKKEILFRDDKHTKVRITNQFLCFPLTWEGEGVKVRNQSIRWFQTQGLLNGLKADWMFRSTGEHATEVSIKGSFEKKGFKGKVLELIAPCLIAKTTKRILNALKQTAERSAWTSIR